MNFDLLVIPEELNKNLHVVWTFILLMARFTGLIAFIPGVGLGLSGLAVRVPAVVVLAFVSTSTGLYCEVPSNWALLIVQLSSEFLFGVVLAFLPLFIISGVQTAGQLASTTMGLQASQLIDPTTNLQLPDISRIYGDLAVVIFLILGGHHALIYVASGMGGAIPPGGFILGDLTINELINRSGQIFQIGVMLSAPVIVALLMTNFVMGLITKAVPTVNIFIVSYPLTVGIGLALSALVVPELVVFVEREYRTVEASLVPIVASFAPQSVK